MLRGQMYCITWGIYEKDSTASDDEDLHSSQPYHVAGQQDQTHSLADCYSGLCRQLWLNSRLPFHLQDLLPDMSKYLVSLTKE